MRFAHGGIGAVLAASITSLTCAWGCSRDWDRFDPSAPGSGGTSTGTPTAAGGGTPTAAGGGAQTGGGGSGGGTGGGQPLACAGIDLLSDDFGDGGIDDLWSLESYGGVSATEQGGELSVAWSAATTGYSQILSRHAYDLRGRSISLEVASLPADPAGYDLSFGVGNSEDDYVEIWKTGTTWTFGSQSGSNYTNHATQLHDPSAYRFLRLREEAGVIYWEISADGAAWDVRAQSPTAALCDFRYVAAWIWAGVEDATASGEIRFDNLVGSGPPSAGWCPTSALTDSFDDTSRDPAWDGSSWNCFTVESGGELTATLGAGQQSGCAYESLHAYDLRGDAVTVEITSPPTTGSHSMIELIVYKDSQNALFLHACELGLDSVAVVDDSWLEVATRPFVAADHRWLRLREDSGTVYYETSSDGVSWQPQGSIISPFDVSAVEVELMFGSDNGIPSTPTSLSVDNYNLPP